VAINGIPTSTLTNAVFLSLSQWFALRAARTKVLPPAVRVYLVNQLCPSIVKFSELVL